MNCRIGIKGSGQGMVPTPRLKADDLVTSIESFTWVGNILTPAPRPPALFFELSACCLFFGMNTFHVETHTSVISLYGLLYY